MGGSALTIAQTRSRFTRVPGSSVLTPAATWEGGALQEPTVFKDGSTWKMWYHGHWTSALSATGYATCTDDPSVPGNWTKYAGNPVLGQGGSGVAGSAMRATVLKDGSTYYAYYTDNLDLWVTTSSDGITWGTPTIVLTHGTPTYVTSFQNSELVKFGASDWRLLVECGMTGLGITWGTIVYSASSPTGPWTQIGNGILNTLAFPGSLQAWCSNPNYLGVVEGQHVLAYHSGTGGKSSVFLATSTDFATWTIRQQLLWPLSASPETDQVADVCIAEDGGRLVAFYSTVNNTLSAATIGCATYPGTLRELIRNLRPLTAVVGQPYAWGGSLAASSGLAANVMHVSGPHTAPKSGSVSQIFVYLNPNTSGPATVRGVIYADSAGSPGSLVAVGSETTIPVGAAANATRNWYSLPFATPASVSAGSLYWLGLWTGSSGVSIYAGTNTKLSYNALKSRKFRALTYSSSSDPSNPFGSSTTTSNSEMPIYAVVT